MLPTERFSNRVENYIRYRPGYPSEIIDTLRSCHGLAKQSMVADVGSGTGMLSRLFLTAGNPVFGIEPNVEMRQAGDRLLKDFSTFTSIAGSAEQTTLPDASIDFVAAGQAFHWFDRDLARREFLRVLRPDGWVVLVWNDRRTDSTLFLAAYENLLRTYASDYDQSNHKRVDPALLRDFFGSDPAIYSFFNRQQFHLESLRGRLLSSSYAPEPGKPQHQEMMEELRRLYETHQEAGQVTFEYDTKVFCGHLRSGT